MEDISICLNCTRKDCSGQCAALRHGREAAQAGPDGPDAPKMTERERRNDPRNRPRLFYDAFGEVGSLNYFAEKYGLRPYLLYSRINKGGMSMEAAISRGAYRKVMFEAFGCRQTLSAWAREFGIGLMTVRCRMSAQGMSLEAALTMPIMSKAEAGRRKRR